MQHYPNPQMKDPAPILLAPAPAPEFFDIDRVLAAVRRQIWVVALAAAIGVALGIAYVMTAVPKYTATIDILIDKGQSKLLDEFASATGVFQDDADMLSRVELLKSDKIARSVATRLDLANNKAFLEGSPSLIRATLKAIATTVSGLLGTADLEEATPETVEEAIAVLQKNLAVKRIGQTYVLNLAFTSPDPQLAMLIAHTYGEAYLDDQLQSKYDATKRASGWLQDRIAELKQQSYDADLAVQKFRNENGLISSNGVLVSQQQLAEINTQLITAQANTAEAKARLDQIQSIIDAGRTDAVVNDALVSTTITQMRAKYLDAARRETEISNKLGPNHIQAQRLRDEMQEYNRLIFTELRRIAESYQSTYSVALDRQRSLERSLKDSVSVNAGQNETQVKLRELERESETFKSLYDNFLQRYQQTVQQQSFPIADARVITPATLPERPSAPNKPLLLAVFLALGIAAGSGVGAVREYRERFFRVGDQVRSELGLDFLGYLPKISAKNQPSGKTARGASLWRPESISDYVSEHPLSAFAETLRNVKVAADIAMPENKSKVIGVVSGLPYEGKSTVAANLANLLALQGARALVIDGDLRNPGLTRALVQRPSVGLLEVVLGNAPASQAIINDPAKTLSVLPSVLKRNIPNTSEILNSVATFAQLNRLRSEYDYIVIDLPPLGPVVDAKAFAHRIDAFVFVVEWGKTSRHFVRNILSETPMIRDRCLGIILNKTDNKKNRLYREIGSAEYYAARYSSYYSS